MDDREDVTTELEWAVRCAHNGRAVDWPMVAAVLVTHLDDIERRARQVEGGHYLKYARPDEVARWIRTGNREETT
jgi:hypothetical protein